MPRAEIKNKKGAPSGTASARCRLCGAGALEVLSERLRNGPGNVWYCPVCELGMLDHDADGSSLAAYYDGEYRKTFTARPGKPSDAAKDFADYKDFQSSRLELLRPHLNKKTRLLEIGCSAGMFLHHAAPLVREAVGIDFDSAGAKHAAKVSGARTFTVPLPETGLPEKSFDLVCLFQTLEHLPDPLSTLREVRRWLADDGRICVEVPNLADPLRILFRAPAYEAFYYHKAHLFYFSAKSLALLMEKAGFEGAVSFSQDYNFLNHLHWHHRQAPQPDNRAGLGPARLPLAPGVPKALGDALAHWAEGSDRAYKAVLAEHGVTANMTFLGKKAGAPRRKS